ncbi:hypothetical protein [Pontibacter pamirensis]|uniref:hypothetical protein n=1 Tax=Pontibacter pamirensis TaxID=2562824 RepID=UPI001389CCF2|nr:hypothetical protein [Pontibacter pamirensis]
MNNANAAPMKPVMMLVVEINGVAVGKVFVTCKRIDNIVTYIKTYVKYIKTSGYRDTSTNYAYEIKSGFKHNMSIFTYANALTNHFPPHPKSEKWEG